MEPGKDGEGRVLLGYIEEGAASGTVPLYWACAYLVRCAGCGMMKLVAQARYDDSLLLGFIHGEPTPGTVPLYWSCRRRDLSGECVETAPAREVSAADGALLGYVYPP